MYSRPWRFLFSALLILAIAAAVGYFAYQAGVAQGVAQGAGINAPAAGAVPVAPFGPFYSYRPFGFGPLGCLVPFLFFFLIFGLFRSMFWAGRWGHGHKMGWGPEGSDAPPMFREWHRRMHEPEKPDDAKTGQA